MCAYSRNSRAEGRDVVSCEDGAVGGATTGRAANARLRGSDLILRRWEDSAQVNEQIHQFTSGETEAHAQTLHGDPSDFQPGPGSHFFFCLLVSCPAPPHPESSQGDPATSSCSNVLEDTSPHLLESSGRGNRVGKLRPTKEQDLPISRLNIQASEVAQT